MSFDKSKWDKYHKIPDSMIAQDIMVGKYSKEPKKTGLLGLIMPEDSEEVTANRMLPRLIDKYVPSTEVVHIALKGYSGQYLIATDRFVYIYKKGKWLTSFTQHEHDEYLFRISYDDIYQINYYTPKSSQRYIEIVSESYHKQPIASRVPSLNETSASPAFRENCFSLIHHEECVNIRTLANKLTQLKDKYTKRAVVESQPATKSTSVADELLKLKQLLDDEVLTQEEFNKLKQKLIEK